MPPLDLYDVGFVGVAGSSAAGPNTWELAESFDFGTSQLPSGSIVSVDLGDSGTKMYLACNTASVDQAIFQYTLSPAYDVSSASYATIYFDNPFYNDVRGVSWKDDGSTWIRASDEGVGGGSNKRFIQFDPSADWNVSTSGSMADSFTVSGYQTGVKDVVWGDSGNQVTSLADNDYMYTYTLGTPYDISTCSLAYSENLTYVDNTPRSHRWSSDGTLCFYLGSENDKVYQLNCSTAWDIRSFSHDGESDIDLSGETTAPYGLWVSDEDIPVNIYVGADDNNIYQYELQS